MDLPEAAAAAARAANVAELPLAAVLQQGSELAMASRQLLPIGAKPRGAGQKCPRRTHSYGGGSSGGSGGGGSSGGSGGPEATGHRRAPTGDNVPLEDVAAALLREWAAKLLKRAADGRRTPQDERALPPSAARRRWREDLGAAAKAAGEDLDRAAKRVGGWAVRMLRRAGGGGSRDREPPAPARKQIGAA
ncbi:hypothetical protein JKP88DRAFT_286482 [Tribonema minus]|uniref:Uncharacterized protein n=1 Tax=Tribonema minus TaxID=303371 RepID=A0A836CLI7_9STRA|nr:hypothetical protein JKP88DRAFT_286482 [Tribonema minus]